MQHVETQRTPNTCSQLTAMPYIRAMRDGSADSLRGRMYTDEVSLQRIALVVLTVMLLRESKARLGTAGGWIQDK